MLRIYMATAETNPKGYFSDSLSQSDYFVRDQDIASRWGGELLEKLGLSSERPIAQREFARLCDNLHPITGDRLTLRTRDDRTVGYDLTFHAPKGVSLLHALSGDRRITDAFREAVSQTMRDMQRAGGARVRLDGKSEDRHTGALAWGEFLHTTTRPVDGVPDPHLHQHCFAFNATWDPEEARVKAAQFREMVALHPYFQASFHTRLALGLNAIGYRTERVGETWDLAGVD
jgi:conjugative relaxase-like TrwC/TraI family protein